MTVRQLGVAAYLLLAVGLVGWAVTARPNRYGDGHEYFLMTESLTRNASPALTPEVSDFIRFATFQRDIDYVDPPDAGFFPAPAGRRYSWHFWSYPLSAVPARLGLKFAEVEPLRALQLTNVGWYLLAVGAAGFAGVGPPLRRATFLLLTAVGPPVWYLPFTGAEVYTWALVVVALVALDNRWYAAAAFSAGLGALQNPLAALYVAAMVGISLRDRSIFTTTRVAAAGAVCLLAPAFYWWHYGVPSLVAADPVLNTGHVTWARSWGLVADPNYGLLPYAPGLVLLAVAGLPGSLRTRLPETVALLAAVVGAGLLAQKMSHWNGAALGPHRYLLWLSPPLAWVAANGSWFVARSASEEGASRPFGQPTSLALRATNQVRGWLLLGLAVAVQGGILVFAAPERLDYLRPNALARWVWRKAPALNNPDPQVFGVRNTGREKLAADFKLPIAFVGRYGVVTKLLLTPEAVPQLSIRFQVEPAYLAEVERLAAGRTGFFYLHPPKDAVRCWPGDDGRPPE